MPHTQLRLKDFLSQKRVFFEGTFFSCEDIIKYTANKLGGAHLDSKRDEHFAKLDKAAAFMKFGAPIPIDTPNPPSELYMVLEEEGAEILSAVHIEIIAAATSFIQVELSGKPVMTVISTTARRIEDAINPKREPFRIYDLSKGEQIVMPRF